MRIRKFPYFNQHDYNDCGHTCIRMIAKFYKKNISTAKLKKLSDITFLGLSIKSLAELAEKIGFKSLVIKTDFNQLQQEVPLPCIVYWKQRHFVVVYKTTTKKIYVADPSYGLLDFNKKEFTDYWIGKNTIESEGIILLLEPTLEFFKNTDDKGNFKPTINAIFKYVLIYKRYLIQLFLGVLTGSLLQLIFPLLTQSMVDIGINNRDVNFIYLILAAQLMLFVGKMSIEFIKNWIILHLGARVNIAIISDFLIKIMKLPISFFESKHMGSLLQRVTDHDRIEQFLNSTIIEILFAITTLVIYGTVIALYSLPIFFTFLWGSIIYFLWIVAFLAKRRRLDYTRFEQQSANTNALIELFTGMTEIKLNDAEIAKRWKWEEIQAKLFKVNIKTLGLKQLQEGGSLFINEVKNIFITVLAATQVVNGQITLGMMLAISYIIGQLNGPLLQIINMVTSFQDTKIALERIAEVYEQEDEEPTTKNLVPSISKQSDIQIKQLCFKYEGNYNSNIIDNLSMTIPHGKTTAIVGTSGSGKTTLLKILLKLHKPTQGDIYVGGIRIENLSAKMWRKNTGCVMQEGYIFSDTVANNIAVGNENIDFEKLYKATKMANIQDFVEALPLGYDTKIGRDGAGISVGQKQRILIARAIYKNPDFIFFDEATSALDATNEKIVMQNLNEFLKDKTCVVIAHRLSTVKNADQIVVLEKGRIIEQGTHTDLVLLKGAYYSLVKNQLELGQ